MSFCKILLIEKVRRGKSSFATALRRKGYVVEQTQNVSGALEILRHSSQDIIVLDAASMMTSGARLANRLREHIDGTPLILIAPKQSLLSPNSVVDDVLVQPLTARKLSNRIMRLQPGEDHDVINAGPIYLNVALRRVRCFDRVSRLTPRSAEALQLLMARPGRLVRREEFMRRVWHTDYMGDTRTLDVHISWLRKAIEPDPASPSYLKTIRGVGFRLDVPHKGN